MRVKLDTGGISNLDQNRGIGVYAAKLKNQLSPLVTVVEKEPDLTHYLVFKLFSYRKFLQPAVVTVHDLIPLKYPQAYPLGIKGRWQWWRNKQQLLKVKAIITDSLASKRDIVKLTGVDKQKIYVIYLAAHKIFKPRLAANKFHLPKKFTLYVGDLNWNKNVVFLTKICLKLNYPLVVVGRQAVAENYDHAHPETRELVEFQHLARANPKKIICLGALSNEDLAQVYNLATVYVQPSRDEGFGLPVLEAMACGCPVLTSRLGSLSEIGGGADLKFSLKNMKRCWESSALRFKMSQAGLKQAAKFSWARTARQTVSVYEKILNQ